MRHFFGDETNTHRGRGSIFQYYGGVVITESSVPTLNSNLRDIRKSAGYRDGVPLKFDTNSRPDYVSISTFTNAKRETLEALNAAGCAMIVTYAHHDILAQASAGDRVRWTINTTLRELDDYLMLSQEFGTVSFDLLPFPDPRGFLIEKLSKGLVYKNGYCRPLNRITHFSQSSPWESFLQSAADVAVGALAYCGNVESNPQAVDSMLPLLSGMLARVELRPGAPGPATGLISQPALSAIKSPSYLADYIWLRDRLS